MRGLETVGMFAARLQMKRLQQPPLNLHVRRTLPGDVLRTQHVHEQFGAGGTAKEVIIAQQPPRQSQSCRPGEKFQAFTGTVSPSGKSRMLGFAKEKRAEDTRRNLGIGREDFRFKRG